MASYSSTSRIGSGTGSQYIGRREEIVEVVNNSDD